MCSCRAESQSPDSGQEPLRGREGAYFPLSSPPCQKSLQLRHGSVLLKARFYLGFSVERRERGKTSLTQLIGCYREKAKKAGVWKRLNGGIRAVRGPGRQQEAPVPAGPGVGAWAGRWE